MLRIKLWYDKQSILCEWKGTSGIKSFLTNGYWLVKNDCRLNNMIVTLWQDVIQILKLYNYLTKYKYD